MNKTLYVYCLIVLFAVGCQPIANNNSHGLATQVSNNDILETPVIPTNESSPTTLPTIVLNKISATNSPDARLNNQCLNITSTPSVSSSVIILRSLKNVNGRQSRDVIFIDMSESPSRETTQKTQITNNFAVSAGRKLIAYEASTIKNGEVVQLDLIIANGNLQIQNSIPWDDKWGSILGWTTDQKIIISLTPEMTSKPPISYILVDPLSGEQQAVRLGISDFLDKPLSDIPYWDGWYGLLIDPTLKVAVYPRQSSANKEMYTYALWDILSNKTVLSLENIFSAFSMSIDTFPMPSWSIDGTQFAFVGVKQDVLPIKSELFRVTQDGDVEQLTNISNIAYVWPSSHSWSSDNSHIAFFLGPPLGAVNENANVALVNTGTLDATDLCLSVGFQGSGLDAPATPIWSPNGKQFLIVDRFEKDRQRVLLVDIEKNTVSSVAEGVEPIGWMVKP